MSAQETDKLLGYGSLKIKDHFSLRSRGSRIYFEDTNTVDIVWSDGTNQYVIEDDYDENGKNEIEQIKLVKTASTGLILMRGTYTLVCLFWTGFLLVCSLQLLLYLVLDLLIQSGATEQKGGIPLLGIGTFLAFPLYLLGLANVMIIAGSYVSDTWNGQELLKEFAFGLKKAKVKIEWLSFLIFLGLPVTVMCIAIFSGRKDWWEVTSLFWFYSIGFLFFLYASTLIATAVYGSFIVTRNWRDILDDGIVNDSADFWETVSQAIQTRNHHCFSGLLTFSYITEGSIDRSGVHKSLKRVGREDKPPSRSLWTRFVSLGFMDFFYEDVTEAMQAQGYNVKDIGVAVKNPSFIGEGGIELFDMDDVQGYRPFLTRDTWSLEKIFCRDPKSRYVVVYDGPDAVTKAQMYSSVACFILGNTFGIVVLAAALRWFGASIVAISVVIVGLLTYRITRLKSAGGIIKIIREMNLRQEDEEDDDGKSLGLFQVWRRFRTRQPKRIFCFLIFGMEVFFLFLWPLFTLYFIGNHKTATVFLILGLIFFVRSYFDPAIVLEETNQMSYVDIPDQPNEVELDNKWSDSLKYSKSHWTKQSRLVKIVNTVNRSKLGPFWLNALASFLFILVALFAIALATKGEKGFNSTEYTYLKDFYYDQQKDLPYPTCNIGKGERLGLSGASSLHLSDYVFVAGLAYADAAVTQPQLDKWFGEGSATDQHDYVEKYRTQVEDGSAVTYKFVSFARTEGKSDMGLISIRGTTTAWDALTDIQLWSAAAVFQLLRELLPGGQVFSPILNHLVNMISWLASESINRVAFYKETTAFAKAVIEDKNFEDIQVTGHSLGGGLAIITGAQANIPAIALSGPNALIGRDTFEPPVSVEALNTMTFNIIPDRDIVPRFDDRAKLFQEINCLAGANDLIGCHNSLRSLCEIIYTCGTMGRPALCECHTLFGYPKPQASENATETFEEACADAQSLRADD
mmetsp:Transcript_13844/g.20424  ORF Transcript_13844/g.20424 Transcript_13844/m.20424 type:complete len:968 (+) Transcript_13844:160-3063(+)